MDPEGIGMAEEVKKWLTVVWLIVGGPLILAALPIPALEPLRKLIWPVLRRGKLLRSNESSGGVGWQNITVPQSFFTHFYLLGLTWNTILFFTTLAFSATCTRPAASLLALEERNLSSLTERLAGSPRSDSLEGGSTGDLRNNYGKDAWRLVLLLLLFEIHLARRLYECLVVSSFDPSARMNFLGYMIALGYYLAVPLTLFLQSFRDDGFVDAFKGFLNQKLIETGAVSLKDVLPSVWDIIYFLGRIGWTPYVGAALCVYGSIHQHTCHEILASIRPLDQQPVLGGKKYGIPRGDWFELVSSAHYLAEIVIYAGLLIVTGGIHPAMWVLFISVGANLSLLAKPTHEWYLSKFDNYPTTRRALFPYIG